MGFRTEGKFTKMSLKHTMDLKPREFLDLDVEEFLKRFPKERHRFSSIRIVPPKLGSPGFGKIRAELKVPMYGVEAPDERQR